MHNQIKNQKKKIIINMERTNNLMCVFVFVFVFVLEMENYFSNTNLLKL